MLSSTNIRVFCRFRPFNQKELEINANKIHRLGSKRHLIIKDPNRTEETSYMFDRIFDMHTTQQEVFEEIGRPILDNILDGFNGTIMAYGQTSSGKTHTMQGSDLNDREDKGLIPRFIENLFMSIEKSAETLEFKLKVSICEVYMQKIRDLLDVSKTDLRIRENKNGPYVQNLTEAYISERLELHKLIQLGQKNRYTCATNMNAHSSRSHLILSLTLNQLNNQIAQAKTSKLFLIDLAGSEKVAKTGAEGQVLEQAKKINLSLASLGKVIKSLSLRGSHVSYRDSKLTRIIKDSLGGNSKTTLIVTCSPHETHISQTLSTLRFGENAQKIKNKPKINKEMTVEELQKTIESLEKKIQQKDEWIAILQNYIKEDLKASLPKMETPSQQRLDITFATGNNQRDRAMEEVEATQSNIDDADIELEKSGCNILEESDQNSLNSASVSDTKEEIVHSMGDVENVGGTFTGFDEQITSLESQLSAYKQNLQSQLHKFYLLKRQYNALNENLKEAIQENIAYQEKEKDYEEALSKSRNELRGQFQVNIQLFISQISEICRESAVNEQLRCISCQNVLNLIQKKGAILLEKDKEVEIENGQTKDLISLNSDSRLNQVANLELQDNIDKPSKNPQVKAWEQEAVGEDESSLENCKIMMMEQKLDKLYHECQQLLAQQANWKVQCQLYELKLRHKNEKIEELKQMLCQISEQMELMDEEYDDRMSVNTKIVKPIKGGFLFH